MYQHPNKGRERAGKLIEKAGYGSAHMAHGGHSDFAQDKAMIEKAISEHESHDHPGTKKTRLHFADGGYAGGGMAANRLDQKPRGGGKKGGKGHTNIEINVTPHHPGDMGAGPMPGAMPPGGAPAPAPRPAPPPVPMPRPTPAAAPPVAAAMPPRPMPGPMPGGAPPGAGAMPPGGMPPRPMVKRGGKSDSWEKDDAAQNTSPDDEAMFGRERGDIEGEHRGGRTHHARGGSTANRLADGDVFCEGGRSRRADGGMTAGAGSGRGRIEKAEREGFRVD